jgi:hypothetical protein
VLAHGVGGGGVKRLDTGMVGVLFSGYEVASGPTGFWVPVHRKYRYFTYLNPVPTGHVSNSVIC